MMLHRAPWLLSLIAVLAASALPGCETADLDETDGPPAPASEEELVFRVERDDQAFAPRRPAPRPDAGVPCGTKGGVASCGEDQFCKKPAHEHCGATDFGGTCAPRPEGCLAVYDPVCGCDGRTYPSACSANAQGVSVKRQGPCGEPECAQAGGQVRRSNGASVPTCDGADGWSITGLEPTLCCLPKPPSQKTCGGFAGLRCEAGQFCNYEVRAGGLGCEGVADASGVCEAQPRACTREYRPVCGCDRRTYGNACTAHAAGVSVLRSDACTELDCAAVGGKVVNGIGPAPVCPADHDDRGPVRYSSGAIAIEGSICCVPR